MKLIHKALTALLIFSLSTALLTGCAGSPAADSAATAQTASSAEPAEAAPSAEPEAATVQVSTIDELLAALKPDTTVQLAPGTYNLTEASDYGEPVGGRYYTWENDGFSDAYGLRVQGADHLAVLGGEGVEIVTEPRMVHVLTFRGCNSLTLQALTVGHTEAAEACEGGVIRLEECEKVTLTGCSLYGCGTTGVCALDVQQLVMEDCDIYHCSSSAVSLYQSSECRISGGSVYDLGTAYDAEAAFCFTDATDVIISGVSIHDNSFYTFVNGAETGGIKFKDCSVTGNHISAFFDCDGTIALNDVVLESNTIGNWFSSSSRALTLRLNGDLVQEEDLNALWGDQLASAGVGTKDVAPVSIDRSGTTEVHVTTADEFFAALASDSTIYIDVPQLNLTDVSCYSAAAADGDSWWGELTPVDFADAPAFFRSVYDGAELVVGQVQNLHIVGDSETGSEIVTEPRYAYVLRFYGCDNVTFENIILGHSVEPGYCVGGVLYLDGCSQTVLQSCDLYGCGIYGIEAWNSSGLFVQGTLIHDCTYGAAQFHECADVAFIGSTVAACPSPQLTLDNCSDFTWDGTLMDAFCTFDIGTVSEAIY